MTITLTGYGGVEEIGGNAFLLEAPGLRAMLDIGRRFGAAETMEEVAGQRRFSVEAFHRRPGFGDYFHTFVKPRGASAVRDLAAMDLLPWGGRLPALYRPDLGGAAGEAPVDMILLSHAHMDHCGLLGLVRPDIPVATSAQSLATLQSIETTGDRGWETDFTDVHVRGAMEQREDGYHVDIKYNGDETGPPRRFLTEGTTIDHSKWRIQFHHVDHSIQGAAGFVLTDGDHKIVYTGDFRQHGLHPEKTRAFLKAAVEPDVLIMEGTRVGDAGHATVTDKETDVEQQVRSLIEQEEARGGPPFVGVGYPPRDLDRLRSMHRVAQRLGRRLVINTKQAHVLDALRRAGNDELPDWASDPNLGVYVGSSPVLDRPDHLPFAHKERLLVDYVHVGPRVWAEYASKQFAKWEFYMLGGRDEKKGSRRVITEPLPFGSNHLVRPADVQREPSAYLFTLNLYNMPDLLDIFPDRAKAGGLYIHSQTQPHNDDMEMDQFRLRRWLRAFNLNAPDHEPRRTHVSGHLSQEDIAQILDELRPKLLVPIHSERPDLTRERYERRTGRRAILPRVGHAETIG